MRRVLISHSWDHPEQYDRLRSLLSQHQYEFIDRSVARDDPLDSSSSLDLRRQLAARISQVSSVLLMATDDVHKKPFVNFEVEEALRQGKRLVAVKPWGAASGPVPRLIDEFADAIVGFRGDQIVPALDGENIRNLSEYIIAEEEDLRNLAHWIVRGTAVTVILATLTAPVWLPRLNCAIESLGVRLYWHSGPPATEEVLVRGAIGALIGGLAGTLLDDRRLAFTLAAAGGAIGAGSAVVKALSLQLVGCAEGLKVRYQQLP